MSGCPTIAIDQTPDRAGWAVVTLAGRAATPIAVRVLGATLIDLFDDGVDTITVETSRCERLSPEAYPTLVEAARYARLAGGCLVVAGLSVQDRVVLRSYDVDHQLDLAR